MIMMTQLFCCEMLKGGKWNSYNSILKRFSRFGMNKLIYLTFFAVWFDLISILLAPNLKIIGLSAPDTATSFKDKSWNFGAISRCTSPWIRTPSSSFLSSQRNSNKFFPRNEFYRNTSYHSPFCAILSFGTTLWLIQVYVSGQAPWLRLISDCFPKHIYI